MELPFDYLRSEELRNQITIHRSQNITLRNLKYLINEPQTAKNIFTYYYYITFFYLFNVL